ncbi:hypothetical protein TcasGA2_TC007161 [Tribolium castaneum]|uniref:Uncharacterized protein n=1 Tax=Tribolium castaneum TaxID=7070 RepID=D2A116_TRICA|nr:hypothetical protein TcasGA2_TC007161 [Tribolium castaneum]
MQTASEGPLEMLHVAFDGCLAPTSICSDFPNFPPWKCAPADGRRKTSPKHTRKIDRAIKRCRSPDARCQIKKPDCIFNLGASGLTDEGERSLYANTFAFFAYFILWRNPDLPNHFEKLVCCYILLLFLREFKRPLEIVPRLTKKIFQAIRNFPLVCFDGGRFFGKFDNDEKNSPRPASLAMTPPVKNAERVKIHYVSLESISS